MSESVLARNDLLYDLATYAGWAALLIKVGYYIRIEAWPWVWHYSALWFAMLPSIVAMIIQVGEYFERFTGMGTSLTPGQLRYVKNFAKEVEVAEYSEMWVSFVLNRLSEANWFTNDKNAAIDYQNLMVWQNITSFWLKTISLIIMELVDPFMSFDAISIWFYLSWNGLLALWYYAGVKENSFESSVTYILGLMLLQVPWYALLWALFDKVDYLDEIDDYYRN